MQPGPKYPFSIDVSIKLHARSKLFCVDLINVFSTSGVAGYVFEVSKEKYEVVQFFIRFELSRFKLCNDSDAINEYKRLLPGSR